MTELALVTKTASGWEMELSLKVSDPEGWVGQEEDFFSTPITLSRFRELCHDSVVRLVGNPEWG